MENFTNKENTIRSQNQTGGITAQNVIITNHSIFAGGINAFFKVNRVKISLITISVVATCTFLYIWIFMSGMNNEEFYNFANRYYKSINDPSTNVREYFADHISIFYMERNITPEKITEIRSNKDFKEEQIFIDKQSIILAREHNGIQLWNFSAKFICYRPSKKQYQKCRVEVEFGIDDEKKIVSIDEKRIWDLSFSKNRPNG